VHVELTLKGKGVEEYLKAMTPVGIPFHPIEESRAK